MSQTLYITLQKKLPTLEDVPPLTTNWKRERDHRSDNEQEYTILKINVDCWVEFD